MSNRLKRNESLLGRVRDIIRRSGVDDAEELIAGLEDAMPPDPWKLPLVARRTISTSTFKVAANGLTVLRGEMRMLVGSLFDRMYPGVVYRVEGDLAAAKDPASVVLVGIARPLPDSKGATWRLAVDRESDRALNEIFLKWPTPPAPEG